MAEELDWAALRAAVRAGREAEQKIADYYDSLTPEQIEQEFAEAEPVEVNTPRAGIAVTWDVRFEPGEIGDVLRAASALDLTVGAYLKHLALLDARGHALTAVTSAGTARCEHMTISGVCSASCVSCGPLTVERAVTV